MIWLGSDPTILAPHATAEEEVRAELLTQLEHRFGPVPDDVATRIGAAALDRLALWSERLHSAKTAGEILGE